MAAGAARRRRAAGGAARGGGGASMSSAECFAYFNPTDRPTVESRTKEWTAMLLQAPALLPGGPAPPPRAATAKWAR